jgi:hypothetical protein
MGKSRSAIGVRREWWVRAKMRGTMPERVFVPVLPRGRNHTNVSGELPRVIQLGKGGQ